MRIGGRGRADDGDSAWTDRIGGDETQRRRRCNSRERSRSSSHGGGRGRLSSSRNGGNDRGRSPRDDDDVGPGGHLAVGMRATGGGGAARNANRIPWRRRPAMDGSTGWIDDPKYAFLRRANLRVNFKDLQVLLADTVSFPRSMSFIGANEMTARMMAADVPSAAAKSSDVGGFAASDDEEAKVNDEAFRECLRDVDKGHSVWELARQLPRRRWNKRESRWETWNERERKAVIATMKSVSADLVLGRITRPNQHQYEFESHSSDDNHPPGVSNGKNFQRELLRMEARLINAELSKIETRFIDALPHCLPLNRGFHVTEFGASEICYCPCGQNVKPWRKRHEIFIPRCNQKDRFQPHGLMDHLKVQGGVYEEKENGKVVFRNLKCFYHYATAAVYLRTLFSDWHCSSNVPSNTCKRMDWSAIFLIFRADSLPLLHMSHVRPKILVTRRFILHSARNTEGRMTKTIILSGRPWRLKTERTRGSRGRWKRMRGFR